MRWSIVCITLLALICLSPLATASVVISEFQGKGITDAKEEFISVYNNSDSPVDVTNWCIEYSSASDATKTRLLCLVPPNANTLLILEPFTHARFASPEFNNTHNFIPDKVFTAGMNEKEGHLRVYDSSNRIVDTLGWGSAKNPEGDASVAHGAGQLLSRKSDADNTRRIDTSNNSYDFEVKILELIPPSGIVEEVTIVDHCSNIEGLQPEIPYGFLLDQNTECQQDMCLNLEGLQISVPTNFVSNNDNVCTEVKENATITVTELLPNVTGSDTGKEYIELYNPNNREVNLKGYKLELWPLYVKSYTVLDQLLAPFSYVALPDSLTGLVLPNTTASVRLTAPAGNVVSETDAYNDPKDDAVWALIDEIWQYSTIPTPGAPNLKAVISAVGGGNDIELCPEGKFRNPETNRCKNIESGSTELTPCKASQERNPETNRCRSVVTNAGTPTPCKAGQERNPETNRCRSVLSSASTLAPCKTGQERNPETNRCRSIAGASDVVKAKVHDIPSETLNGSNWLIIGGLTTGALSYAVYEWRHEIIKRLSLLNKIKIGSR